MPSSGTLDRMFSFGLVIHLLGWIAALIVSVAEKKDSAKRLTAVWIFLGQLPLFISYIFHLIDAGLYPRNDGELFAQPFFVGLVFWSLFAIIATANIERLSKANGILVVLFFTTSAAMFGLAGRENEKKPRDALYAIAWLPMVFSIVYLFFTSRLRRMLWVDWNGHRSQDKLPFTTLERVIQHISSIVACIVLLSVGITLGISPCIGHRISASEQYIGYLFASCLTLATAFLQYFGTREIGNGLKTD